MEIDDLIKHIIELCEKLGEEYCRDKLKDIRIKSETMILIYNNKQLAVKIAMNSNYGDIGNPNSQTPCYNAAKVTTYMGRAEITRSAEYLSKYHGCHLIYGDTDSVMVKIDEYDQNKTLDYKKLAIEIEKDINDKLFTPPMVLEYENLYRIFFSFKKKNYTVIKIDPQNTHLVNPLFFGAKGVPCVKRDRYIYVRECYERIVKLIMVTYGSLQMDLETFKEEIKLLKKVKYPDIKYVIDAYKSNFKLNVSNIEFNIMNIGEIIMQKQMKLTQNNHYQTMLDELDNPTVFRFLDQPMFNGVFYRYHLFTDIKTVHQFDFYYDGTINYEYRKYKNPTLKNLFYQVRFKMEQPLLMNKIQHNKLLKTINIKDEQSYKNPNSTNIMFFKRMQEENLQPVKVGDRLQVLICKSPSKYRYDQYETLKTKEIKNKEIDEQHYVENMRKAFLRIEESL